MACSSTFVKDFLNIHGRSSSSWSEKKDSSVVENNDNELFAGGSSLKLRKGMFQTMDLFQNDTNNACHGDANISKTVMMMKNIHHQSRGGGGGSGGGDGGGLRRIPSAPLLLPEYFGGSRPASCLERSLLPELKRDARLPTPSLDQTETAQLTIFYSGIINVYDNVPVDKAQAIMLLANQCSVSPPTAQNATKVDIIKRISGSHSPSSLGNAPEELPIARRHSLRRFLEKRRGRIINKVPYAISNDDAQARMMS